MWNVVQSYTINKGPLTYSKSSTNIVIVSHVFEHYIICRMKTIVSYVEYLHSS